VTSGFHGVDDLTDIRVTVARRGKEMKDSSVVPYIVSRGIQVHFSDVCDEPMYAVGGFAQSFPVRIDGRLRNIEDGDVLVSAGEKVIDQRGFTAANINDRSRPTRSRLLYQGERRLKVRTVPTDCVGGFLCVDFFPMGLCVHTYLRPYIDRLSSMIDPSQTRRQRNFLSRCVGS